MHGWAVAAGMGWRPDTCHLCCFDRQVRLREYDGSLRAEIARQQELWQKATEEAEAAPAKWERMSASLIAWRREYLTPLLESQYLNRQMWREQVGVNARVFVGLRARCNNCYIHVC